MPRIVLRRPRFPASLMAVLLVCAFGLPAFGGAATPSGEGRRFLAGAATSNITPPLGISLAGIIGQNGVATHIHDELYARCLVLDDGSTRLAIAVCDNTMISQEVFDRAKQRVAAETGLPMDRMLISATHSHSTPRSVGLIAADDSEAAELAIARQPGGVAADYEAFLSGRIADGIIRAINNLAPAKIGWASGAKPEWVFNRRWALVEGATAVDPFGGKSDRVQMNPRSGDPKLAGPSGGVDPEVFVLSVQHEDGRPLALLANYGLHYVGNTGAGVISADYFGAFADRLRLLMKAELQDPPFIGILSNGTSGDVNSRNFAKPEPPAPPYAKIAQVADSVAREAYRVYQTIEHRTWVPLTMKEGELEVAVRRPDAERVRWARSVWEQRDRRRGLNRAEVYAREALALAEFPATVRLKLQAIAIGDLGIAAIPCEVFAATGLQIKERSPLARTFTISLANGYHGYLPTPRDHALGGYETWPARSSYLEVQASEKIRDEVLRLLTSVQRSR